VYQTRRPLPLEATMKKTHPLYHLMMPSLRALRMLTEEDLRTTQKKGAWMLPAVLGIMIISLNPRPRLREIFKTDAERRAWRAHMARHRRENKRAVREYAKAQRQSVGGKR
jgi:hypothetical protein